MLRFGSSEALNFVGLWKKLTIWTASSSLNSSTEKWINLNNFSALNVCTHYLKCSEVCLPSQLFQLLFQLKGQIPNIPFTNLHKNLFSNLCDLCVKFSHRPHMPAIAEAKHSKLQEVVIDVPNDFQGVVMEVPPRPGRHGRRHALDRPTIHGTNLVYP